MLLQRNISLIARGATTHHQLAFPFVTPVNHLVSATKDFSRGPELSRPTSAPAQHQIKSQLFKRTTGRPRPRLPCLDMCRRMQDSSVSIEELRGLGLKEQRYGWVGCIPSNVLCCAVLCCREKFESHDSGPGDGGMRWNGGVDFSAGKI